jgi:hypothetical protein
VDLVFSHVVVNHVEDLDGLYATCAKVARREGGCRTRSTSPVSTPPQEWNGHRAYGEFTWKVIAGRRPYFVSREPVATHLTLLDRHGFEVVNLIRGKQAGGISRRQLAPRWRGISDEDLETQTAFIVCRRR